MAARPNFVKVAPLITAMTSEGTHEPVLIHAGQHYDAALDEFITSDLKMPPPNYHLGVGSGTHGYQVGETMVRLEEVFSADKFAGLVVAGDVNATLAGALVAAKARLALAHLEAGIRSYDRSMPEEINRVLTDQVADLCLTPSRDAAPNLLSEGIDKSRIHFVGNTMIDSLDLHIEDARSRQVAIAHGLAPQRYGVITLHRPANVDDEVALGELLETLGEISGRLPLLFPIHPRTLQRLGSGRLPDGVNAIEPMGYVDFLSVVSDARLVLTDSGGIQEETTVLGVPCITLRDNTERPVTITEGTNRLSGTDRDRIWQAVNEILDSPMPEPVRPDGWDGHAAERGAEVLARYCD